MKTLLTLLVSLALVFSAAAKQTLTPEKDGSFSHLETIYETDDIIVFRTTWHDKDFKIHSYVVTLNLCTGDFKMTIDEDFILI